MRVHFGNHYYRKVAPLFRDSGDRRACKGCAFENATNACSRMQDNDGLGNVCVDFIWIRDTKAARMKYVTARLVGGKA